MAFHTTFTHQGRLYSGVVIKGEKEANDFLFRYDGWGVLKTNDHGSPEENVVYLAPLEDMGEGS